MKTAAEKYMGRALVEARFAAQIGEIPIGAVIVHDHQVIGTGHNLREHTQLTTQHAELMAIEAACLTLHSWRLTDCTLYVTIEPCLMCAGAILNARIPRVVYGAANPKAGAGESLYQVLTDERQNHQVELQTGCRASEAAQIMQQFFRSKRKQHRKKLR
ncbi:tRNA adenosine(34) deaminase TadA [Fructilactobacillus ixorae]|uniref:tRNA-specific adenosine deaminase n=1 Tax=Fructilactobacillus ixorae TaxID=1750535 RepID=A0ABY5C5Z3_9LACO|nr:tRNA adenosine(34) deaminase TadA [Fructilactobacillus ixorae]USS93593.1 tRNA adenosine(34) deaminase TadA [Fructilactobacillus ixorae]